MKTLRNNELEAAIIDWPVHMQRALDLAGNVLTAAPNPRVGCVISKQQNVIAEGWHVAAGEPHAEAMALNNADQSCVGSTAFVSLEPCSHLGKTEPCADALIEAGVSTVVIAMIDPNPKVSGRGVEKLEQAGIDVVQLKDFEEAAIQLNPGFVKRFEQGKPVVRMKLAQSLDGRTALANGESKWITSVEARADVQRMRAMSCAIITGADTVLADDPLLTVRKDELDLSESQLLSNSLCLERQPLRVVLDSKGRVPAGARVFQEPGNAVVYTQVRQGSGENDHSKTVDICTVPANKVAGGSGVDLSTVLESLAAEYECNEVLLEAGPTLCGAFLQAGLVDELVIYIAPRIFGSDARPLLDISGIESLSHTYDFAISDVSQIGSDIKAVLLPSS